MNTKQESTEIEVLETENKSNNSEPVVTRDLRKKTRNKQNGKSPKIKGRVYRLRGYTTVSRVEKKVAREQLKKMIRNFLVAAVFILIIAILLIIFNPMKDLTELFRIIGI